MSHDYKRKGAFQEFMLTAISGVGFGATTVAVGHPFDTIKTKMQAQTAYLENASMRSTVKQIWRSEGILGFWHGWLPPLAASSVFRSLQFAVMETVVTKFKQRFGVEDHAMLGVLPWSWETFLGGFLGGTARSFIECVSENMKVNRQVGQSWKFRNLYKGLGYQIIVASGMFSTFVSIIEGFKNKTNLMDSMFGQFIVGCVAGTIAWYIVWPFEYVKNLTQCGTEGVGESGWQKFQYAYRTGGGFKGLFRGFVPGTICYSLRNGASLVAMAYVNKLFEKIGLREVVIHEEESDI